MSQAESPSPRRIPSVAALLSLVTPGVGQVYAGRIRRGMVLLFLSILAPVLLFALAWAPPSRVVLSAIVAVVALSLVLYVFAIVDAYRAAKSSSSRGGLSPYQRPAVYTVLLLLGLSWCLGGHWFVRAHALQAFIVPTASMKPAIQVGDRILVDKLGHGRVNRGDVIVFRPPHKPGVNFIKRVTATAGDEVDGKPLKNGMVWVEGDLRKESVDSRSFGPVAIEWVVGKAVYRFWGGGGPKLEVLSREVPQEGGQGR